MRAGGRGKYNSNSSGAFRKAKYEKLRQRKKKRRKRGRVKIPSLNPFLFARPSGKVFCSAVPPKARAIKIQSPDFRQKKFGFCPKDTANFHFLDFGWNFGQSLPRPCGRQSRPAFPPASASLRRTKQKNFLNIFLITPSQSRPLSQIQSLL